VPLLLHPIDSSASERLLPSPAASEGPQIVPQSAEAPGGAEYSDDPALVVAAAEPRATDDLPVAPLGAVAAGAARTVDADVVLATAALGGVSAPDLADPSASVKTGEPASGMPLVELPPISGAPLADEAVVVVAAAEPRGTDDLALPLLGSGAVAP